MTTFPTEIWCRIVCFACTDTGYTGRALSLVSKSFCEVTKPVKYQSVAIAGLAQLLQLCVILERTAEKDRCVCFLFVSDKARQCAENKLGQGVSVVIPSYNTVGVLEEERRRQERRHQREEATAAWNAAFRRLLHLVKPSVRMLTVYTDIPRTCTMLPVTLPKLVELTIHSPVAGILSDNSGVEPFVYLQRLHLSLFPVITANVIHQIRRLAPSLRYLLLSGIEKEHELYHPIAGALAAAQEDEDRYWNIQNFSLCPCDPLNSIHYNTRRRMMAIIGNVRELAKRDSRFVVLEPRPRWTEEEAEQEWLNRVNGGEGCWEAQAPRERRRRM